MPASRASLTAEHDYLRRADAPDFWALLPYYVGQHTDSACSVAVVTTLINARAAALRAGGAELVTPSTLLDRVGDETWKRNAAASGAGVTLDELAPLVERAVTTYALPPVHITVQHVKDTSPQSQRAVRDVLTQNELSSTDSVIVNFLQSTLTGDADAAVGHMALVAAFDSERSRVLVLDPDRRWYEPYWVSLSQLVAALATTDPVSHRARGLLWVRSAPQRE